MSIEELKLICAFDCFSMSAMSTSSLVEAVVSWLLLPLPMEGIMLECCSGFAEASEGSSVPLPTGRAESTAVDDINRWCESS